MKKDLMDDKNNDDSYLSYDFVVIDLGLMQAE